MKNDKSKGRTQDSHRNTETAGLTAIVPDKNVFVSNTRPSHDNPYKPSEPKPPENKK